MSARWLLCNSCRSSCCKTTDEAESERSHLYCGCQSDEKRTKMYEQRATTADIDKQNLITKVCEAIDYDYQNKPAKEEWETENPTVPFRTEFCDLLEANRSITILGEVHRNALSCDIYLQEIISLVERLRWVIVVHHHLYSIKIKYARFPIYYFTVNFCKGTEGEDIGLHLNPRFDQHYVPRNCRVSSTWGSEEAQTYCKYPFQRGKSFFMEIFLTHTEFLVAIDGLHFCAFRYRYPIFQLDTLEIFGDISLTKVKFVMSNQYPSELPESCDIESLHTFSIPAFLPEQFTVDLSDCNTPHIISLKQPINVGNEIEISGRAKLLPYSFYINLQEGKLICPHPVISLHMNVRFKQMSSTTSSILVNSWQGKGWGDEAYASENCYFLPGQPFTLQILCTTDAFHISHNGHPIVLLEHRTDYTKTDTVYIVGDVLLNSISFR